MIEMGEVESRFIILYLNDKRCVHVPDACCIYPMSEIYQFLAAKMKVKIKFSSYKGTLTNQ